MVSTFANLEKLYLLDGSIGLLTPYGIATEFSDNVYIADSGNHRILKMTASNTLLERDNSKISLDYIVSVLAGSGIPGFHDGIGTLASFNSPYGLTVDQSGFVYVAETSNHAIRKISPDGFVTILAGTGSSGDVDGAKSVAKFNTPYGIAIDLGGNVLVADTNHHKIRKIDQQEEIVTTLAGTGSDIVFDGPALNAGLRIKK